MRFVTITMFAVIGKLLALAAAKPIPDLKAGGMAIPLTRYSSFAHSSPSIDPDALTSHSTISVREKIVSGLDNYEMNTGSMHPFAMKRSGPELRRGASVPLTTRNDVWVAEISIGTPPKTLQVEINTGASDLWVLQTGCDVYPGDHDFWDPHSSESAKNSYQPFELTYGDGSVINGDQYADNVTIAGFTADPQTFGSATSVTAPFHNNEYHADGMLGLAFPSRSKLGGYPLFESLASQGRLIDPTFSLKLSSSGAEMYVGGANSMLYTGVITYIPVTDSVPGAGLWHVNMDNIHVRGDEILPTIPVIFDSSANYIYGGWRTVGQFYRRLGGTLVEMEPGLGFYYLPCNAFPRVSFTFGGRSFEIPPENFNLGPIEEGSTKCFAAIVGERWLGGFWTIGTPFLQGVYSVFNYSTKHVGLADLA